MRITGQVLEATDSSSTLLFARWMVILSYLLHLLSLYFFIGRMRIMTIPTP